MVGITVNQHFSTNQRIMLQNHAGVKNPFKEQDEMHFNVMMYNKFI